MTEGHIASGKSSRKIKLSSLLEFLLVFLFFALIPLLVISIITYSASRNVSTSVTRKNFETVATVQRRPLKIGWTE